MAKDKYDFIQEILNNEKLSPPQRERILKLTTEEIKRDKELGNLLEQRVKTLEEKFESKPKMDFAGVGRELTISLENVVESTAHNNKQNNLPDYNHPGNLYKFLFEYNQNRILKSTCHEIDADALADILEYCESDTYNFEKHSEKIIEAFEEHDRKYFCASSTKALIRGYLTGKDFYKNGLKDGWSSDKIKIGWSSDELQYWAKSNRLPPNSTHEVFKSNRLKAFDFKGFTSDLLGKRVQTFRELVLHFKSLFHIRVDNSLKTILTRINELKEYSSKVEIQFSDQNFPSNIELFTDVDKLIQGYIRIIELAIEQHSGGSKPRIILSFYESGTNVRLSIHHLNNTYNKTIANTIERLGQTYTNLIGKQLNGMCNLYLKADFGFDGIAEINLWNGEERTVNRPKLKGFDSGIEHILEFCKRI